MLPRFAADSALEEAGFEPSVPGHGGFGRIRAHAIRVRNAEPDRQPAWVDRDRHRLRRWVPGRAGRVAGGYATIGAVPAETGGSATWPRRSWTRTRRSAAIGIRSPSRAGRPPQGSAVRLTADLHRLRQGWSFQRGGQPPGIAHVVLPHGPPGSLSLPWRASCAPLVSCPCRDSLARCPELRQPGCGPQALCCG
jgi:hypothetical protein